MPLQELPQGRGGGKGGIEIGGEGGGGGGGRRIEVVYTVNRSRQRKMLAKDPRRRFVSFALPLLLSYLASSAVVSCLDGLVIPSTSFPFIQSHLSI
jgi:hypothetical protein